MRAPAARRWWRWRAGCVRSRARSRRGISTRLIVYCATLIAAGIPMLDAVLAGTVEPLTDEPTSGRHC
jgi:hypothetical protein